MSSLRSSLAALILLTPATIVAQETPPAAEGEAAAASPEAPADPAKKYADLRKSKDRATQALADRYDVLMGVQEWVDQSGKHKTKARYLAHDPDLKWVKLATAAGKEATVQLSQLHKSSQAKVRQIAALQRKLDELAAGDVADSTGTPEAARSAGYEEGGRGNRAGRAVRGERGVVGEGDSRAAAGGANANVDRTQWATSYDAFRANITVAPNAVGERGLDWGDLQPLKAAMDAAAPDKTRRPKEEVEAAAKAADESLAQMSEVHWEAPLVKVRQIKTSGEVEFRLPSLPKPLKMRFLTADEEPVQTWLALPANKPVKFVGRFESVKPREIVVRVRLDNSPAGSAESPAASPATAAQPIVSEPATSENPLEGLFEER